MSFPLLFLVLVSLGAPSPRSESLEFADLDLRIDPPPLEGLAFSAEVPQAITSTEEEQQGLADSLHGLWTGKLGESEVAVGVYLYDELNPSINEPGDVSDEAVADLRELDGSWVEVGAWYEGGARYGYAPLVKVVEAEWAPGEGRASGAQFLLAGLLTSKGYVLHVRCDPVLDGGDRKVLLKYFRTGIHYDGPERDADWTQEEAKERWIRDMPESMHEDFLFQLSKPKFAKKAVIRTENYIVLTNSSSGKNFAQQLEENYEEIRATFPFEEVEGQRLMPIYLFRTRGQYKQFFAQIAGISLERAGKSGGHAWRDYYATWYEAPGDPVHIHECTHQIFHNRLGLGGAGSWYQEGVAEYMETADNERNTAARLVKKGEHTPLAEFVTLKSLLHSSKDGVKGGSAAGQHYKQAALLIEFLRESKFGKGKFTDFIFTMGRIPRNDEEAIEAAFRRIYGLGFEGMDAEWQEYCERR